MKRGGYISDSLVWAEGVVEPVCTAIGADLERCWPPQVSYRRPKTRDERIDPTVLPQGCKQVGVSDGLVQDHQRKRQPFLRFPVHLPIAETVGVPFGGGSSGGGDF